MKRGILKNVVFLVVLLFFASPLFAQATISPADIALCERQCWDEYHDTRAYYDDLLDDAKQEKADCEAEAEENFESLVEFCKEGGWKKHWDSLTACIAHMERGEQRGSRCAKIPTIVWSLL